MQNKNTGVKKTVIGQLDWRKDTSFDLQEWLKSGRRAREESATGPLLSEVVKVEPSDSVGALLTDPGPLTTGWGSGVQGK